MFCSDLEVMLQSSDFEKPPENNDMSPEFQKQLEECTTGSVAFVYEEKGEGHVDFSNRSSWRSTPQAAWPLYTRRKVRMPATNIAWLISEQHILDCS